MPFYEYECQSCKFYSEVMQKISDPPLRKCPSCGKNTLQKLVSAPNFRLKGGGWYETDFKSEQEAKRNLAKGDEAEKASKPAEGGETKAAERSPDAKAGESKPSESKPAPEVTGSRRGVAAARTPVRSASSEGAARRSAPAKQAATRRPAAGRPAAKVAARRGKVSKPTRGKSRR